MGEGPSKVRRGPRSGPPTVAAKTLTPVPFARGPHTARSYLLQAASATLMARREECPSSRRTKLKTPEVGRVTSTRETTVSVDQRWESCADRWTAEGRAEGIAAGEARGRKQLILRLVRTRFGDEPAVAVESALQSIRTVPALNEIFDWIVTYDSADTLMERIGRIPG